MILGETELEIEVDEPEPRFDPSATRLREPRHPSQATAGPGKAAAVGAGGRHQGAAGIVLLVIAATAVALIVYFVAR